MGKLFYALYTSRPASFSGNSTSYFSWEKEGKRFISVTSDLIARPWFLILKEMGLGLAIHQKIRSSLFIDMFVVSTRTDAYVSADWMVDVVSADNTAYIPIDWHNRWLRSPEIAKLRYEIQGFQNTASHDTATDYPVRAKYMTTWAYQLYALTIRGFAVYWRSPCYLFAKLALNILTGLLIGFTFFKAHNSIQGTQDKLFVRRSDQFHSEAFVFIYLSLTRQYSWWPSFAYLLQFSTR